MHWWLILLLVLASISALVFILTRDSFVAARAKRKALDMALLAAKKDAADALNKLTEERLPLLSTPADKENLVSENEQLDAETLADSLDRVAENTILPQAPKAYLTMVEHGEGMDKLLSERHSRLSRGYTLPPR